MSLCAVTPLIRGVMAHDIEKDHFPARLSEYFRGEGAGNARTGPAGAVRPGRAGQSAGAAARPGTTSAAGRPRHGAVSREKRRDGALGAGVAGDELGGGWGSGGGRGGSGLAGLGWKVQ